MQSKHTLKTVMDNQNKKTNYIPIGLLCIFAAYGIEHVAEQFKVIHPEILKVESVAVNMIDPVTTETVRPKH